VLKKNKGIKAIQQLSYHVMLIISYRFNTFKFPVLQKNKGIKAIQQLSYHAMLIISYRYLVVLIPLNFQC
jgi:hypothetical protein